MFEFSRESEKSPRQQIIEFIQESGRHVIVFPDAGGPYRQLKHGMIQIALDSHAELVPVELKTSPSITLGRTMQHRIPIPFSRLKTFWGTPLTGVERSATAAEDALRSLSNS